MGELRFYGTEMCVGCFEKYISGLSSALKAPFPYIILEYTDRVEFYRYEPGLEVQAEALNRGRVFSNACEIKWRRKGDRFVVVLTTAGCLSNETGKEFWREPKVVKYDKAKNVGLFLWGTRLENFDQLNAQGKIVPAWFEKQIPKPQYYPVVGVSSHVRLNVTDYYDSEGRLIGRLLVELVPWPEKEGGGGVA